jgi:peptidoglycan/LPS O-acetylase OafA/YrhL
MAYVASRSPFYSPITPLWSVSVEEQFYFVWPLFVRYANRVAMLTAALCLCLVSFVVQFNLFRLGVIFHAVWFNSFVHAGEIGIGILAAVLLEGRAPRLHFSIRIVMFLGALIFMVLSHRCFHFEDSYVSIPNGMMAFGSGLLASVLLFFSFLGAPQDGLNFLTDKTLVYLGRISYGLYVIHVAALDVVKFVALKQTGACSPWTRFAFALPVTLVLALLSYRWFESPFLKLKQKFSHLESGAL